MKSEPEIRAEIERIKSERDYMRSLDAWWHEDNLRASAKIAALTWALRDVEDDIQAEIAALARFAR